MTYLRKKNFVKQHKMFMQRRMMSYGRTRMPYPNKQTGAGLFGGNQKRIEKQIEDASKSGMKPSDLIL